MVVSYGITSRVAQRAIDMAHERGLKVGKFRLITAWPFPETSIRGTGGTREGVRRSRTESGTDGARSRARRRRVKRELIRCRTRAASVHHPEEILNAIVEASRC